MERKILLKELVNTGANVRRDFTPTAVVSNTGRQQIGEFWDANKTIDVIVNHSHDQHDNIRELDEYAHGEEARAKTAEAALAKQISDETTRATEAEQVLSNTKQENLVSGENIKTVAGQSILGSGNIIIDYTSLSNKPDLSQYITQHQDLSSIISRIEALEQAIL